MRILLPAVARPALLGATSAARCATPLAVAAAPVAAAPALAPTVLIGGGTFWLARPLFLRWLGGVYAVAFLAALRQNRALLGSKGLQPIDAFLRERRAKGDGFRTRPSLFWFAGEREGAVDRLLDLHAIAGLALSVPLVVLGGGGALQMGLLWLLYLSLVSVGQIWYQFGWESLLCEMGFLAIFVGSATAPTPAVAVWALRWLLFRVMLGAGLIKLRGDSCWRDLSAMDSFYETQPVPTPLSRPLHYAPKGWHRFETFVGLWVVEVVTPFLLLLPGGFGAPGALGLSAALRTAAAAMQLLFQAVLIAGGNLAFLNWLTIAPAFLCLDDAFLGQLAAPATKAAAAAAATTAALTAPLVAPGRAAARALSHAALAYVVAKGSVAVVRNMLSTRQKMNACFGPWRLVNSYGAFGTVTSTRFEVILEGTRAEYPTDDAEWREYEFVAKPGDVTRKPRWLSPYHLRLDWLMWFLPFAGWRSHAWLPSLTDKLLANDAAVSRLLRANPFVDGAPPRWVRARLFEYEFAPPGDDESFWRRKFVREYMPPQQAH